MKAFNRYVVFFTLVLGLANHCFAAQQSLKMSHDETHVSDNYYVQPGGVYVAPDGIFVLFNGELIQVNTICTDARGVFVPGIEMGRQFVWCSICQRWYDPDGEPHRCK